jgi:hypothetical protein
MQVQVSAMPTAQCAAFCVRASQSGGRVLGPADLLTTGLVQGMPIILGADYPHTIDWLIITQGCIPGAGKVADAPPNVVRSQAAEACSCGSLYKWIYELKGMRCLGDDTGPRRR